MSFSERLESHDRTTLDDVTENFKAGVRQPFNALEGRVIDDPAAPDPIDYADDESGRRRYLRDCWEFALADLQASMNAALEHTQAMALPSDPSPGDFDGFSRDETDDLDRAIIELRDAADELIAARQRVEAVEEAMRDA